MYSYISANQLEIEEFKSDFKLSLDPKNRWIKLSSIMPWDEMVRAYTKSLSADNGSLSVHPRVAVGALVIKYFLDLSDRETIETIQENPYMQFFLGLNHYTHEPVFDPSLLVDIRKRMNLADYDQVNQVLITKAKKKELTKKGIGPARQKKNWGKLQIDATVCDQYIRYPTDLSLLNEAREISEEIIDDLFTRSFDSQKPRTYRRVARKQYLAIAKKKNTTAKERRKGIRQQLGYLKRNLAHINDMLDAIEWMNTPREKKLYHYFLVIQEVYRQQEEMYRLRTNKCDDRIVSLHQPHVRPMVRGKAKSKTEFGSKISLSLNGGFARVDQLSWDSYNEGGDLITQVEAYKQIHGHYPELVQADKIYATRANRQWLKENGIRLTAQPLGRSKKEESKYEKQKRKQEAIERNAIEGKFGQGKNGNSLSKVRAKLRGTSESWIGGVIFAMNIKKFMEVMLC